MKNIFLLIFFIFCSSVNAQKPDSVVTNTTSITTTFKVPTLKDSTIRTVTIEKTVYKFVKDEVVVTPPPQPQSNAPEIKAIYIDKTSTRIVNMNDVLLLNLIFDPSQKHGNGQTNFNQAWFYDMSATFANSTALKALGDWISVQHKKNQYFKAGCVESFSKAYTYNLSQTDSTRRFDLLIYESEYWNQPSPVSAFVADSARMVSDKVKYVGKASIKGIEFYNGHFSNSSLRSRAPRWFAQWPVAIHSYMADPASAYVAYRYDSLNAAGMKEYKPITSSEAAFWGPKIKLLGLDSCNALQKKMYLSRGGKNWKGTVHFDFEYYVYYTFSSSSVARLPYRITAPLVPTTSEHLRMSTNPAEE